MISRDGRFKLTNVTRSRRRSATPKQPPISRYGYSPHMPPRRPPHRPRDRSVECELKFRVAGPRNHARIRAALRKRGAKLEGKYNEENYRFDGPGKSTRGTTLRLRVLNGGPHGVLTVKGPAK